MATEDTQFKKNSIPWNKGKIGVQVSTRKGKKLKPLSKEHKEKIRLKATGRVLSTESKLKMRKSQKKRVLEGRNNLYKGGITPINIKIRNSLEMKLWRKAVLERDNYTCIWCGSKEKLEVDHIKPFALFPELRFAIDNGRVLCSDCHKTTDTYGCRLNNIKKI